jgi:hypothetical protein
MCSYVLCMRSHFFTELLINWFGNEPLNLELSGKKCYVSMPFFTFLAFLLIQEKHLTIVFSGCTGALWHWHALIRTLVSCLLIWYAKWNLRFQFDSIHLWVVEDIYASVRKWRSSYWETVTDATINNRVEQGYLAPLYVCNTLGTSSRLGLLVLPKLWRLVMGKPPLLF